MHFSKSPAHRHFRLLFDPSLSPTAFRVIRAANKGTFSLNPKKMFGPRNWDNAKPSMQAGGAPAWMIFDDEWVDEVKRALSACKV